MLGFSNKNKQDESVDAEIVLKSENEPDSGDKNIETHLSIPDNWKMPSEERYIYAFHNNGSPKLKQNQVSIYGMELLEKDNKLTITGLIRNTVPKEIKFGSTVILLLNEMDQIVARKTFDLSRLGAIPQNGARPWEFTFLNEELVDNAEISKNNWKLAFELKKKHQLDLEESWEQSIAEDTKTGLERIVANAKPLKPGEFNFMGVDAKQNNAGNLVVTVLIRNGSSKNIQLEQVPLAIKDATDEEVARGGFKMDDFTVKANTSKPWTFIFPAATITKDDVDLSRWKVVPIENE